MDPYLLFSIGKNKDVGEKMSFTKVLVSDSDDDDDCRESKTSEIDVAQKLSFSSSSNESKINDSNNSNTVNDSNLSKSRRSFIGNQEEFLLETYSAKMTLAFYFITPLI